jgi:hypothetical protein
VLLVKALSSGCDAKRQAKRLLLIARLEEREFVCGRMHKILDTNAAFRLVGSKVYVCVASKYEWLAFFYVRISAEMQTARRFT